MNNVDFDKPISKKIFQSCIDCGRFINTNDKTRLILFMLDHYGEDKVKKCKRSWYGHAFYTLLNWKYRNV